MSELGKRLAQSAGLLYTVESLPSLPDEQRIVWKRVVTDALARNRVDALRQDARARRMDYAARQHATDSLLSFAVRCVLAVLVFCAFSYGLSEVVDKWSALLLQVK